MAETLERMDAFFDARVEGYEEHMFGEIEGARAFYPETARRVAPFDGMALLDLGCGTGLELDEIDKIASVRVTGIDLSAGMLKKLREKHPAREMELVQGSYFDVEFGKACFDAAVSVETMHHFRPEKKLGLYRRLCEALKPGGRYVETDYMAANDEDEALYFRLCDELRAAQGIAEGEFFHYDTPCTAAHQIELLKSAGFSKVEAVWHCANTYILVAQK